MTTRSKGITTGAKRRKYNKKGGVGQEWIFALSTMFGLTVLVMSFNVVYHEHLKPAIVDQLPDTAAGVAAELGIDRFLAIWDFLPYIILGMVILFLFVISIKKEAIEREY